MINAQDMTAQPRSLHDNVLVSYAVYCSERRIVLNTLFKDKEPHEHTDVEFHGVVGYHFEGDALPSIIFDISEVVPEEFYSEFEAVFSRVNDKRGVVIPCDTKETLSGALREKGIRIYVINSSYGLHGFVLAERMELEAVKL